MADLDPQWNEKLKRFDALLELHPEVERKGKTMPYSSANGYMFAHFNKAAEVGLRLSKTAGAEFIEKYNSEQYRSYGANLKEVVLIPDEMMATPEKVLPYLDASYKYVLSLPAKKGKK